MSTFEYAAPLPPLSLPILSGRECARRCRTARATSAPACTRVSRDLLRRSARCSPCAFKGSKASGVAKPAGLASGGPCLNPGGGCGEGRARCAAGATDDACACLRQPAILSPARRTPLLTSCVPPLCVRSLLPRRLCIGKGKARRRPAACGGLRVRAEPPGEARRAHQSSSSGSSGGGSSSSSSSRSAAAAAAWQTLPVGSRALRGARGVRHARRQTLPIGLCSRCAARCAARAAAPGFALSSWLTCTAVCVLLRRVCARINVHVHVVRMYVMYFNCA